MSLKQVKEITSHEVENCELLAQKASEAESISGLKIGLDKFAGNWSIK